MRFVLKQGSPPGGPTREALIYKLLCDEEGPPWAEHDHEDGAHAFPCSAQELRALARMILERVPGDHHACQHGTTCVPSEWA